MSELQFEVVKHVTVPLLKIESDPVFVRFEEPIVKADPVNSVRVVKDDDGNVKQQMEPPELARITNLVTGLPAQIIVNAVLGSELRKKYPNDGYVGHSFRLVKSKIQGKRYSAFEITEVRLKGDAVPAPAAPAKTPSKR